VRHDAPCTTAGLNEHYEVTGEIINGSIAAQFIPDDTLWLPGIPVGTVGTAYANGSTYASISVQSGGKLNMTVAHANGRGHHDANRV
jgi:hypothetical protein